MVKEERVTRIETLQAVAMTPLPGARQPKEKRLWKKALQKHGYLEAGGGQGETATETNHSYNLWESPCLLYITRPKVKHD